MYYDDDSGTLTFLTGVMVGALLAFCLWMYRVAGGRLRGPLGS